MIWAVGVEQKEQNMFIAKLITAPFRAVWSFFEMLEDARVMQEEMARKYGRGSQW